MNRRTNEQSGFVRFPTDDPRYRNTHEGGMFVVLTVDPKEGEQWSQCCGPGNVYQRLDEVYVNSGVKEEFPGDLDRQPYDTFTLADYLSVPHFAAITLGSTGWSGWNDTTQDLWECTMADLTPEGQLLVAMLQKLYGDDATIQLHTYLDT